MANYCGIRYKFPHFSSSVLVWLRFLNRGAPPITARKPIDRRRTLLLIGETVAHSARAFFKPGPAGEGVKAYARYHDPTRRWQLWGLSPSGRPKACMGDCDWPVRIPHRYSTVGAPRGGWIAAADSLGGAAETAQHCYSRLAKFLSDKAEASVHEAAWESSV